MGEFVLPDILRSTFSWEILAVALAIAYLLLATQEKLLCWYAAFVSSCIYAVLFWDVSLPMQAVLNLYYVFMAVYGWWSWQSGSENGGLPIRRWRPGQHGMALAGILILSVISGYWLASHDASAWPYVDSFTTWASVITTWMVARKILESWLYWIVIDLVAMMLYVDRGLYLTALLFLAYTVIAVFGYFAWRRHSARSDAGVASL